MAKPANNGFFKRHLDKFGVAGSVLTALCCLGFAALLSILSAIGLGFLINDAILLPLLIAFLLVTLGGLYLGVIDPALVQGLEWRRESEGAGPSFRPQSRMDFLAVPEPGEIETGGKG